MRDWRALSKPPTAVQDAARDGKLHILRLIVIAARDGGPNDEESIVKRIVKGYGIMHNVGAKEVRELLAMEVGSIVLTAE